MTKQQWTKEQQKEHRKLWIEALRSGEYEQGYGVLRDINDNYCCLGVACEVAIKNGLNLVVDKVYVIDKICYSYNGSYIIMTEDVMEYFGIRTNNGDYNWLNIQVSCGDYTASNALSFDNDCFGKTFNVIADIIEKEPNGLCK